MRHGGVQAMEGVQATDCAALAAHPDLPTSVRWQSLQDLHGSGRAQNDESIPVLASARTGDMRWRTEASARELLEAPYVAFGMRRVVG